MKSRYSLEIYEPGSADDVAANFESDTPFQAIHRGDLIRPMMVPGEPPITDVLRVECVEQCGAWRALPSTKYPFLPRASRMNAKPGFPLATREAVTTRQRPLCSNPSPAAIFTRCSSKTSTTSWPSRTRRAAPGIAP
jgi:hypothetical protein